MPRRCREIQPRRVVLRQRLKLQTARVGERGLCVHDLRVIGNACGETHARQIKLARCYTKLIVARSHLFAVRKLTRASRTSSSTCPRVVLS